MGQAAAAAVSEQRQWDRLMAMARIGAIAGDGVNRACLTELDRQARRLLIGWAKEIGASVSVDAAANLWLRRDRQRSARRAVVTGSHMDTQPNGGRFDGIYGVIAGLEALAALHEAERDAAPPGRGGGMDQRRGRPLRPRLHGQHVLERLPPHRGIRRRRSIPTASASPMRSPNTDRRGGPAAPPAGRPAARLCRGAYRAGPAPGSREAATSASSPASRAAAGSP